MIHKIKSITLRLKQLDRLKDNLNFEYGSSFAQLEFFEKEILVKERELITLVKNYFKEGETL